jgi:hypothetical protein
MVDSAMFPAWATDYMSAIEATLGEAYSGPADDVRGYLAWIKSPEGWWRRSTESEPRLARLQARRPRVPLREGP